MGLRIVPGCWEDVIDKMPVTDTVTINLSANIVFSFLSFHFMPLAVDDWAWAGI
jgi:hypothetical protein